MPVACRQRNVRIRVGLDAIHVERGREGPVVGSRMFVNS